MRNHVKEPTFDRHGYPTGGTIAAIRRWPYEDRAGLLEYLRQAWSEYGVFQLHDGKLTLVTGGWSGNESIVSALRRNAVFWGLCWRESHYGGKHVFEVGNDD